MVGDPSRRDSRSRARTNGRASGGVRRDPVQDVPVGDERGGERLVSGVLEEDGDPAVRDALHLADAPGGVADAVAELEADCVGVAGGTPVLTRPGGADVVVAHPAALLLW